MNQRLGLAATALTLAVIAIVGFVDSVIDDRAGPAVLFAVLEEDAISHRVRALNGGLFPANSNQEGPSLHVSR